MLTSSRKSATPDWGIRQESKASADREGENGSFYCQVFMHQMRKMNRCWSDPTLSQYPSRLTLAREGRVDGFTTCPCNWLKPVRTSRSRSKEGKDRARDPSVEEAEPEDLCEAACYASTGTATSKAQGK